MTEETWNENSKAFGLESKEVLQRIQKRDGVYTILFEHLEKVSGGNVIENTPELYISNVDLDEKHYFHVTYPILLRVKACEDKKEPGFICIGVGIRLNGKVKIYSPFFANQPEKLWRLVQSHVSQVCINDFSVRTHLGVYHFTSNQYHVPIYNFFGSIKEKRSKNHYDAFLTHVYALFSRGL
jgi:hypothetical protein